LRIGVDLGGTKIEAVLLSDDGAVRLRRRIPTRRDDYPATVEAIGSLVEELERESGVQASVGVGTPGAISPATGLIKNANSTWLNGRPLRQDLESRLSREVRLANDANCLALSEAVDGAGRGFRVVFGVIIGTGTGGGIVIDGHLVEGANAIAGEWGHNPLPWPAGDERPGPSCYCGAQGCIETFLSGPGMTRDHDSSGGGRLAPDAIAARAAEGDRHARETLLRYVDRMARALASVMNVLDPDVIVLGGGLSNLDVLYESVPKLWGRYVFTDRVDTQLVRAAHGDSSGVRGAAWLWSAG
jgi:fructokinase